MKEVVLIALTALVSILLIPIVGWFLNKGINLMLGKLDQLIAAVEKLNLKDKEHDMDIRELKSKSREHTEQLKEHELKLQKQNEDLIKLKEHGKAS